MTKSLRERVLEHFATLRIPLTAEQLDRVLTAAEQEALSALEVLDRLVGEQAARRRERSIERRIVAARFAERKTLDTFDWNFNKTIQRVQYEQLATAEFVRLRIGPNQTVETDEVREALIGMTESWRLLYIVYLERADALRIVSARAASATERKLYEHGVRMLGRCE